MRNRRNQVPKGRQRGHTYVVSSAHGRELPESWEVWPRQVSSKVSQTINSYTQGSDAKNKFCIIANFHNLTLYAPQFGRFSPENKGKIKPYTYFPFGLGPRICIGMRFATEQAKLAIAHLILNFKVSRCQRTNVSVHINSDIDWAMSSWRYTEFMDLVTKTYVIVFMFSCGTGPNQIFCQPSGVSAAWYVAEGRRKGRGVMRENRRYKRENWELQL